MMRQCELIFSVLFAFVALPVSMSGSTAISYNNPALGIYQNEGACFPLKEKWYIMYRNFKEDPYFGESGKCITIFATGPFENNYGTFEVDVGDDVKVYMVKNVIHVDAIDVPGISFNITSVYTDCSKCKVVLHSYIDGGCSLWQPESALGQEVKCCQFIYDLVCGPRYPLCEEV